MLKGIETGDPASVAEVNEEKYIQYDPQTQEGSEGLAALFKRLSMTNPRVNLVRVFADGDYVFAHTEYDFATRRIGFEVFRFEDDLAVEHWDNIQQRRGPNSSGRTMVDGPTEATDLDLTESNREIARLFVEAVLINRRIEKLAHYIERGKLIQHNPEMSDGLPSFQAALEARSDRAMRSSMIGPTGCWPREVLSFVSTRERARGSTRRSMIFSGSPSAKSLNIGTRSKRSRQGANGRTTTASSDLSNAYDHTPSKDT